MKARRYSSPSFNWLLAFLPQSVFSRIRIYNWKKLAPLAYLSYHSDTVNAVNFSDDLPGYGQILAAGGKDTRISLWSLYNEKTNTEK